MKKFFEVKKEQLRGSLMTAKVASDGEYLEEADDTMDVSVTTGFSVIEYQENGEIDHIEFYPVKINPGDWTTNEESVLRKIKREYSAYLWQNNDW